MLYNHNTARTFTKTLTANIGGINVCSDAFNAKELDEENNMYYYSARYYAPPTFISRDPMFEKYPSISPYTYCRNNPLIFVDPTGEEWDLTELSSEQQEKWKKEMSFACENSELFKEMYNQMDKSETSYKVKIGETQNDVPGQFNASDNTITFKSEDNINSGDVYIEEIFHAYQKDNSSLYESGKSFNMEFEAKVAKMLIKEQMGLGFASYNGTNMEMAYNFLSNKGKEDISIPSAKTMKSVEAQSMYMISAKYFKEYNVLNNYGNSHYKESTQQSPKSLIKLLGK